ncbi:MAG: S46 family peptidase [Calditrichaeota bacterium]|nr:MAG: S46 family peptidase [Calditrichota bacterium]
MNHITRLWSAILLSSFCLFADEGMWLPHQIKQLQWDQKGLIIPPDSVFREEGDGLMNAVVRLDGGTGEFVSANGLILTNHHVAYRAIQRASSPEKDYLQYGFSAADRSDEIPAIGLSANVLLGYRDVTDQVVSALKTGVTFRDRYERLDQIKKQLIAQAEAAAPDLRAELKDMYSGNYYYLFTYKRLQDIRITFAPPEDLGHFGGEVDNWMWPRHTCDFTLLRAYVSPTGEGRIYDPQNVPYVPASFLKLSLTGIREGDMTFVMGYPARTYRLDTSREMITSIDFMRTRNEFLADLVTFFENAGADDRGVQIKYASKLRGFTNTQKNYVGKLEGLERHRIVAQKEDEEAAFVQWTDTPAGSAFQNTLRELNAFLDETARFNDQKYHHEILLSSSTGPSLLVAANTICRAVGEREKSDEERDSEYQQRNDQDLRQTLQLVEKSMDLKTDEAYFVHLLVRMFDWDPQLVPKPLMDVVATHSQRRVAKFVRDLYRHTQLGDVGRRMAYYEMSAAELARLDDPMIRLAAALEKEAGAMREAAKALTQQKYELKGNLLKGWLTWRQGRLAPDANSTIRMTMGQVAGYAPRDAVYYQPQTFLTGLLEKDGGAFPFAVPAKIKELYQNGDFGPYQDLQKRDIPACFLNATTVTGGNSGSPTLNARGEQVGIIFDMTFESVIGDYYIIPELQRSINVDIRFVLFILDKFAGAEGLVTELVGK